MNAEVRHNVIYNNMAGSAWNKMCKIMKIFVPQKGVLGHKPRVTSGKTNWPWPGNFNKSESAA